MKRILEALREVKTWWESKLIPLWSLIFETVAFSLVLFAVWVQYATTLPSVLVHLKIVPVPHTDWVDVWFWCWPLLQFCLTLSGIAGVFAGLMWMIRQSSYSWLEHRDRDYIEEAITTHEKVEE